MSQKSVQILATLPFLPVLVEVAAVKVGLLARGRSLAFRPGFPENPIDAGQGQTVKKTLKIIMQTKKII